MHSLTNIYDGVSRLLLQLMCYFALLSLKGCKVYFWIFLYTVCIEGKYPQ